MNSYRRGLRNGVLANPKLSIFERVNSVKLSQTWSNVLKKNLYYLVRVVTYLIAVTLLQAVNFYQLMQAAMKIEKSETNSQESERKFSRGSSSSGKRARESQVESVQGSTTRGRRQGPTMTQGFGRGTPTGQEERPECPHCHKRHLVFADG